MYDCRTKARIEPESARPLRTFECLVDIQNRPVRTRISGSVVFSLSQPIHAFHLDYSISLSSQILRTDLTATRVCASSYYYPDRRWLGCPCSLYVNISIYRREQTVYFIRGRLQRDLGSGRYELTLAKRRGFGVIGGQLPTRSLSKLTRNVI